jgi:hypothetical protein
MQPSTSRPQAVHKPSKDLLVNANDKRASLSWWHSQLVQPPEELRSEKCAQIPQIVKLI